MARLQLRPGAEINDFAELRFKPGSWDRHGIPEQGCRIRTSAFERILASGGEVEADELIHGLMDWLDVTDDPLPALSTLRALLERHYPADGRTEGRCVFQDEFGNYRVIHVGSVDLTRALVAWQRDSWVIAVAQPCPSEAGRITVAALGPLTLSVALRILSLGMQSFMETPFDSFEGAITMSGSTGNLYSWERGEASTHYWQYGLGMKCKARTLVDCSEALHPLPDEGWLTPGQIVILLGIAAGYLNV